MTTIEMFKWVLTLFSIGGALLVAGRALRAGHFIWIIANLGWCFVWGSSGELQAMILFGVYLLISIYGFWNYRPVWRGGQRYEFTASLGRLGK